MLNTNHVAEENLIKILIAEDEMLIAADIARVIGKAGYEVAGISTRGEDVLKVVESTRPDIVLMDIALRGKMDGIETAMHILKEHQIPVIFVTSNADEGTFQRAKAAKPYAFIGKPFRETDISRAIEMTLERIREERPVDAATGMHITAMDDRLFVRSNEHLLKVQLMDILYLQADRNYCKIHTREKAFLVSVPMGNIEHHLPMHIFVRTHRSYIVNIRAVSSIDEHHEFLMIDKDTIPVSRRLRDEVIKRFKMI